MVTKLFRRLSDDTFERIIVKDPEPYLAQGWTLKPEAPAKVEEKPKRTTKRKKTED